MRHSAREREKLVMEAIKEHIELGHVSEDCRSIDD